MNSKNLIFIVGGCLSLAVTHSSVLAGVADGELKCTTISQALLAGPLGKYDEIVFTNRVSGDDHGHHKHRHSDAEEKSAHQQPHNGSDQRHDVVNVTNEGEQTERPDDRTETAGDDAKEC